jgi:Tfp pilus assembly protein PilN
MPQTSITKDLRKLMAFGSGLGIEIGAENLEIAVTRVRLNRVQVLGRTTIAGYAGRPAAEWGAEITRFLNSLGAGYLSGTVLLPRRDVIVRLVSLPGVASKDVEGAIRLQLDSLHPYGEEDVVWGWSPLGWGAVLVGVARRDTVDRYHQLFTEAGVPVASFTFAAAAMHAAVRLNGPLAEQGFVALGQSASGGVEVYGESPARPVFSAEFEFAPQRAAALALSELRLEPGTPALALEEVLPKPAVNPVENDLSRNARPYVTALAGACPRLAPSANVLPPEKRRDHSRSAYIPTAILGAALLLVAGGAYGYSRYADHRYLERVEAEIKRVEPQAQHAAALERQTLQVRARTALLDRLRNQTKGDLDALNELTRLIEPPAWTNTIDLTTESVRLAGEAPQAAPLLKILDSSPFFENSAPDLIQRSNNGGTGEMFMIHTSREKGK